MRFPYKIIDLTHTLNEHTPSWDGGCGFRHEIKIDYDTCDTCDTCDTSVKFRVQQMKMYAGIGTHIDVPAHCIKDGATVERIALNDLVASAICIDVSNQLSPDYKLSKNEILAFEEQHGLIPPGCFVIVYTGWSSYWHDPAQYHNQHKFPSISEAAAQLLLERKIVGMGIDTLSPDLPNTSFPVHHLMLSAGKYIVENVANASAMPVSGAYVCIMPIKAAGLSEAPVRMIGLINQ